MEKKEIKRISLKQKKGQKSGLFGRIFKAINGLLRKFSQKIRQLLYKSTGISALILIATVPVIVLGVSYLIKYTQKSNKEVRNFEIPYIVGKNIAKIFDPGKTWTEQEDYLYSVAAQTYNDESFGKKFSSNGVIRARSATKTLTTRGLFDFYANFNTDGRRINSGNFIENEKMFVGRPPFEDFVYNEANNSVSYKKYEKVGSGTASYSVSKYKKNENLLKLSFTSTGKIKVDCPELKRSAEVKLQRNDVDIIIAIPTNRASNTTSNSNDASFGDYSKKANADATPIKQIARACQVFLAPFLHTAGVSVGIVPYSGKVTLSPYETGNRVIRTSLNNNPSGGLMYVAQAMFYGSDGKAGGDIVLRSKFDESLAYGDYLNWGSGSYGCPIMARRGQLVSSRGMYLNSGAINGQTGSKSLLLDMKTSPILGDNYRFMQMNTNPCYLGFCNTLAMLCEKDCPTYKANPYFMKELTSDIQGLIYDLELFLPFKDEKNKSNFLFLPIVMAGNLFSWGRHPSDSVSTNRVQEKSRQNKARMVVIIANAPDNFEPQEMTYLGFNNDYSEIPMIESDTILFNVNSGYSYKDGKYKGTKGIVSFETKYGAIDEDKGGYLFPEGKKSTARISFPNKAMVRVVTKRVIPSTVQVYNDNGVVDNVGTNTFWGGTKTLEFRGPQQVSNFSDNSTQFTSGNYTTKGPNFGHNLSTKKVKIKFTKCKLKSALLKNQILRFYGSYSNENGKDMISNTSGYKSSNIPNEMKKRMDPCIDCSSNYSSSESSQSGWVFLSTSAKYNDTCSPESIDLPGDFLAETIKDTTWTGNATSCSGKATRYNYVKSGLSFPSSTCQTSYCSNKSGYFIGSYGFEPKCYCIGNLSRFVCAADRFSVDDTNANIDNVKIKVNSSTTNLGSINYSGSGTKYRCFNTSSAGTIATPSTSSYIQMLQGNSSINSRYYSVSFASKKSRSRTIKQTLDVYRTFPAPTYDRFHFSKPCCLEIEEKDRCYGCAAENVVKICTETCTRYGGKRHMKYIWEGGYWCGCKESKFFQGVDSGKKMGSNLSTKCTRDAGDDMSTKDSDKYSCYNGCYDSTMYCFNGGNECKSKWVGTGKYYDNGYKDTCDGICWQNFGVPSEWSMIGNDKSLSCNSSIPKTHQRFEFSRSQQQESTSCAFSEVASSNSKCTYPSIETPCVSCVGSINYNCPSSDCSSCSVSSSSGGMNITGLKWNETKTETKTLGAWYNRAPSGGLSVQYYIDGSAVTPGNSSYLTYRPDLRKLVSSSNSKTGIYRYNLYNFFFVSGDTNKQTTYTYSGNTPSGTISSESNSNLLENKGVYLLPVSGEENTYWVCFCGDANLTLNFEDSTDSSVKFSNIKSVNYSVSLDKNGKIVKTPGVEVNYIKEEERVFYIHPDQITSTLDEDGNHYVDLEITGETKILSIEVTNRPLKSVSSSGTSFKAYAHPNIISDDMKNSRVIDGYDQGTYQRMKLYGNMNYDGRSDLPSVSAIQHLYYNPKDGTAEKRIYPRLEAGSAKSGEEGDFFIQLWDYSDEAPVIRWKIGSAIQNTNNDINVSNSGFGPFKSNYAFGGLHRMFFPYEVYNKNYAGYSYAKHSAQVFMGYTQPVNYILYNNGYQKAYTLSSGYVSSYTRPKTALENLAKDACTKLKTDLKNTKGAPMVFLVKYKTTALLSLERCANYTYSANNEEDLMKVMREISLGIEEISRTEELTVQASNNTK